MGAPPAPWGRAFPTTSSIASSRLLMRRSAALSTRRAACAKIDPRRRFSCATAGAVHPPRWFAMAKRLQAEDISLPSPEPNNPAPLELGNGPLELEVFL